MKGVGAIFIVHGPLFTLFTLLQVSYNSPTLFHKVFVYGTLKRGEPNHNWLTTPENGVSKFIQEGHTVKQYPLVIASRYNIPFLLDYPGKGHNVTGEVFEVDNQMLSNLDILEDHPQYYTRRLESIQMKSITPDEKPILCWTYFLNAAKPHLLELPMLSDYRSKGDHGLQYHERYLRDPNYNYRPEVSQQ